MQVRQRQRADRRGAAQLDDWSSSLSTDGSFWLVGLRDRVSLSPPATRNRRFDICCGDSGIISGDTLS
jgi:hypothetical protein